MTMLGVIGRDDTLLSALHDARAVELELLDGLSDDQMLGPRGHFVEPPLSVF